MDFEFDSSIKPHEQAAQVLKAASSGELSPDVASIFITSIQSMLKIKEVTDIDERLKRMEEQIESPE